MYTLLWNPNKDYNPNHKKGTAQNPFDTKPFSKYPQHYLNPDIEGLNYIAVYMGFTKRFAITTEDYPSEWSVPAEQRNPLAGRPYWYIDFIYKKSRETFGFWKQDFEQLIDVLKVMRHNDHLDKNVEQALLSLDPETLYEAIVTRLKEVGVQIDLSLDWRKGTKWEGK